MGTELWQVGALPRTMPNFYAGRSGKDPDCVRQCADTAVPRAHASRIPSPATLPMSTPALHESPAPRGSTSDGTSTGSYRCQPSSAVHARPPWAPR